MVPENEVVEFVERYRAGFEPIQASFFEWGVAFALHWFREQQVDIAVIETGMGGRLDSTNVVTPEVSVITNIGWDHMDFLGNTLEAIAGEKAGIIKANVPVVVGHAEGSVAEVLRHAAVQKNAPITFVDTAQELPYPLELQGAHQIQNARTALAALHALRTAAWNIPDAAIERGLARVTRNTGLQGRWQVLGRNPMTVADVAHNVDGIRTVVAMLNSMRYDQLHIVLGMVNDKDIARVLTELPDTATYYFCKADIPRGLPADELRVQASRAGLHGTAYPTVALAFEAAKRAASPKDMVLITGSVFVVAEVI